MIDAFVIRILKNRYLPFFFAVPLFFCTYRYSGIVMDAILYVTQYVHSVDPARFAGDPAFEFGNQNSLGFFSPIFGLFVEPLGIAIGTFVYTIVMQVSWIVAAVFMIKALLRLTSQRLWVFPITIFFVLIFSNGMGFSHIGWFQYVPLYACSRSLSVVLGVFALTLLFWQKKVPSLLLILAGTAIHPLSAGWCLPFWFFYFFPKTRIPIIVFSLLFPLSFLLHSGPFDLLPGDWLPRPLIFAPGYEVISRYVFLIAFYGMLVLRSTSVQIKRLSHSLCLMTAIAFYWDIWGGFGEHIFLYQVQPWRAVWLPSIIAVPLGTCAVKDVFRNFSKRKVFTTHGLGVVLFSILFFSPRNILLLSIVAIILLVKQKRPVFLKDFVLVFAGILLGGYVVQQYHTWCLQGFQSFFGYNYYEVYHLRDSFLVCQLVFTVGFLILFGKKRRFVLGGLLALSVFASRFMLLPILPLYLFIFPKEKHIKYWGGAAFIVLLVFFDGVFDVETRRQFLFSGLPSYFPWLCIAVLLLILSICLSKRISYWGMAVWFVVCSMAAVGNYVCTSANCLNSKAMLDYYQHNVLFPQVEERGQMLFFVSGNYVSEPRLQFMTGSYFTASVAIGGIFNKQHYRTALERSHLLYKKDLDAQSDKSYEYAEILRKFTDLDTLVDRVQFLCTQKEITHLVTDKANLSFTVKDSVLIPGEQKVFLYGCPIAEKE